MSFLEKLGGSLKGLIDENLGLAENKPGSLDGKFTGDFARLGDFAGKIDRSAERSYVEDGVVRNIKPRALEIISQEPDLTVVIKKRLFASLKDNYQADLLDNDELLFMRATKTLFENKCRAIAAYERLAKFERIASKNDGIISDYVIPGIAGAIDSLDNLVPGIVDGKTKTTIETIKRVKAFSDPNYFTTWVRDPSISYASPVGDGTGVFELTTVSNISATNSTEFGQGKASITAEDPYRLMVITNYDIDRAITDANNMFKQNNFFRQTESQLTQAINDLKKRLSQVRVQTGTSPIRFVINEDTILYKKVSAYIERTGQEIRFRFDGGVGGIGSTVELDPSATEGFDGLQGTEIRLFEQIVKNIYILMGLKTTTRSEIKTFNEETNNIRRKMRLHYGNKPIIQPMDVVTIYISTKTIHDPMTNQGLRLSYSQDSLLNALDQSVGNLESALNDIKNTFSGGNNGESYLENERNAIAGPDFPLWLWGLMRNDFTRQAAGTCVFNGIVSGSSHSYSGGKYTLSVNIDDNCNYLNKGKVNINPSLSVANSALYDPLTPFKTNSEGVFDVQGGSTPELLSINQKLLNSRSIRAKSGRNKGKPLDEEGFKKVNIEQVKNILGNAQQDFGGQFRRKFTNPDGFVYRWKEGIGTLTLSGSPHADLNQPGSLRGEASPFITTNPFAGQDTMNVLSLLITGQPYNFNTFMKGALENRQLSRDDLFNHAISASFFRGLVGDVTKQNSIWGNFVPFKKLVVNDREYQALASGQLDLSTMNSKLNKLLTERAKMFDLFTETCNHFKDTPMFYSRGINDVIATDGGVPRLKVTSLTRDIQAKDQEILALQKDFEESKQDLAIQTSDGTLSIFGDDISFDPSLTLEDGDTNETKRQINRNEFRKKINNLTLRRLWKVKANEDMNLFIVDDSYDKNYDIHQFERSLSGKQMEAWKSEYATPFEQVNGIRSTLGLEIFADSQGHIRVRPPQYNRMPSSVFRNMLQEKAEKGIKVFPSYLESLFFDQIKGLVNTLEIVEDKIRLYATAVGSNSDFSVEIYTVGGGFKFLTTEDDGVFGSRDLRSVLAQNEPDLTEDLFKKALSPLSEAVDSRINATVNFDIIKKIDVSFDTRTFGAGDQTRIDKISERIRQKTRQNNVASSVTDILSNKRIKTAGKSQVDILKALSKIGEFVKERQRLIKRLKPALTNLRDGVSVNSDNTKATKALLFPNTNNSSDKIYPELLASMIEDENNDDLGKGSGNRYILSDDKIIRITINENEPPFNSVQVDGRLAEGLASPPSGYELTPGGNMMTTAWAVDYDMWQMYGFRQGASVILPFFNDAKYQCSPYAIYLLNLAKKQVFTASCTVIGNEFIQAGEVYYIESYDLLFYANSVTHDFSYGSSYTTKLNFTFGHNPGEYIPTPLDIIGKALYTNSNFAALTRQVRHDRGDNSVHLGILVRDPQAQSIFGIDTDNLKNAKNLLQGRYADQNRKNLSNLLLTMSGVMTKTRYNEVSTIELRIYYNDIRGIAEVDDGLKAVAQSVKAWMRNPEKLNLESGDILPDTDVSNKIDPDRTSVKEINLSPNENSNTESPSSEAWSMARFLNDSSGFSSSSTSNAEDEDEEQTSAQDNDLSTRWLKMLNKAIIDIWVVFKKPDEIKSETTK